MDDARARATRKELAAIHRAVLAREVGARLRLRALLEEATHPEGELRSSALRYLLRVLADAGLLGVSPYLVAAQALAGLPAWSAKTSGARSLEDIQRAVEEGGAVELPWSADDLEHPSQVFVLRWTRGLGRARDTIDFVRRTAHALARHRAALEPDDAERSRAEIYRRPLRAVAALLDEEERGRTHHAAAFLRCLRDGGLVRLRDGATPGDLTERMAHVLEAPAHERVDALEAVLFAEPAVSEIHATREELAEALFAWG